MHENEFKKYTIFKNQMVSLNLHTKPIFFLFLLPSVVEEEIIFLKKIHSIYK